MTSPTDRPRPPPPRSERHVCSFQKVTDTLYCARVEVSVEGTGRESQSRSQRSFNSFGPKTEKPKATTNAAAAFPVCNDSDSWKTNLAIKEGERKREAKKKERRSEGEIELDFPTFLPFWRQKRAEPALQGSGRRQTEDGYLRLLRESFFFPFTHARFSPFPLMNRKCELVRGFTWERNARAPITEEIRR